MEAKLISMPTSNVGKQSNSGTGVLDVKALQYYCSVELTVLDDEHEVQFVLPALLHSGLGISRVGKLGPRRAQRHFDWLDLEGALLHEGAY